MTRVQTAKAFNSRWLVLHVYEDYEEGHTEISEYCETEARALTYAETLIRQRGESDVYIFELIKGTRLSLAPPAERAIVKEQIQ